MSNSNIFLITGLSGAGKTFLLKALEDEGYYTVDNVPPHLIKAFLNVICTSEINKIAIVSDIRWKNTDELVNSFIEVN
ncbi:MAG TPA: RNase adapter RapZ, partial [Tepiditoga sp.]|nr:RNase adapter RapZ [Tepiditoga sp.]